MFSTMLRGYSIGNCPKQALFLFNHMRGQNLLLDEFCFVSVLKSCTRIRDVLYGKGVHLIVILSGLDSFVNVRNSLIQFYGVSGNIEFARQVFDEFPQVRDLISWTTLMSGYLYASQPIIVVDLFVQLYRADYRINISTVLSVISAVSELDDRLLGESLHGYCIKAMLYLDTKVMTALIGMYADVGQISLAKRVFEEAPIKDIVAWNCLIEKCAKYGKLETAINLVELMKSTNLKPNSSTLAGLILACIAKGAMSIGQCIHRYIDKEKIMLDKVLGTVVIDLYSKSGLLLKAVDIFNQIENKDVKTWTAMISGCGVNGQAKDAITFLQKMKNENVAPNTVTFLVALNACSHGGLVSEGIDCFKSMVRDYNLTPNIEHYGCIIDLLGRAGLLDEAYELIKSLPIEGDETAWRSLLATCRVYGNAELAERVKKVLSENFGENPADEMVLTSAYAIAGRVPVDFNFGYMKKGEIITRDDDVASVKEAGLSMIELES